MPLLRCGEVNWPYSLESDFRRIVGAPCDLSDLSSDLVRRVVSSLCRLPFPEISSRDFLANRDETVGIRYHPQTLTGEIPNCFQPVSAYETRNK